MATPSPLPVHHVGRARGQYLLFVTIFLNAGIVAWAASAHGWGAVGLAFLVGPALNALLVSVALWSLAAMKPPDLRPSPWLIASFFLPVVAAAVDFYIVMRVF